VPHADERLAADLAARAGALLVELRAEAAAEGLSGKEAGHRGDQRSNDFILGALAEARPCDAVLSEEAVDDPVRVDADRVWIIDPLDGTREYSEPGRTDWAVHVALWEQGDLVAGAVSLPAAGLVHSTGDATNGAAPRVGDRLRLAVSRSRPPEFVSRLAEELDADLVPMGSAGVKAMSVVTAATDVYVHAGGQYEWDSAAPVAVARAAGLHASRLDGSELAYNQHDPWLPDLIICRPPLLHRIQQALSALSGERALVSSGTASPQ